MIQQCCSEVDWQQVVDEPVDGHHVDGWRAADAVLDEVQTWHGVGTSTVQLRINLADEPKRHSRKTERAANPLLGVHERQCQLVVAETVCRA